MSNDRWNWLRTKTAFPAAITQSATAGVRDFVDGRKRLVKAAGCLSSGHLSICHGGCPVRTYSALGTMMAKDPYCEVYKAVFGRAESHGRKILHSRLSRKTNLLTR